jgi:hypothetical protein
MHKGVYIASDGGRVCRPAIIVEKDGSPRVKQKHLVELSLVRFFRSLDFLPRLSFFLSFLPSFFDLTHFFVLFPGDPFF